ncbi:MAG: hypothetical protein UF218_06395 [Eggerthellaceae bacterium]|nr:hypothetical protein [Eggerthellaceae bacterium]
MRHLEFITTPKHSALAYQARAAFIDETATWSVAVKEITKKKSLCSFLDSPNKEYSVHAQVFDPHFAGVAYEYSTQANATSELSQGCDCLSYLEQGAEGTFLLPLSVVECFENQFFLLEGARVAILGSGYLGLACAYECARSGVAEILITDVQAEIAERNLEAFLNEFARLRSQVVDMRQAKRGHVSFQQAYDHPDYYFGAYDSARKRIANSDVIICATDQALPASFVSLLDFSHRPFIIDCMHETIDSDLIPLAAIEQCLILDAGAIWRHWGVLLAQFLTYSNKMI